MTLSLYASQVIFYVSLQTDGREITHRRRVALPLLV
jgi:hypothetical protein